MGRTMKGNSLMISEAGMECSNGKMERNTMVLGLRESNTASGSSYNLMEKVEKVNGPMENECDGLMNNY